MIKACFAAICICLFSIALFAQPPQYALQAVLPPDGFNQVEAAVVAPSTDFVARAVTPDFTLGFFLWTQKGGYTLISGPGGATVTSVSAMNASDSVVGVSSSGAFYWSPGEGSVVITAPNGYSSAVPIGINDRGIVVGTVQSAKSRSDAFTWTREKGMKISPAERQTSAAGINGNGTLAGNVFKAVNKFQAFTADKKGARPIGIVGQTSTAKAFAINSFGVVGIQFSINAFEVPELALWSKTEGIQLSGGDTSIPCGLTDFGDVLAFGDSGSFLWNPSYGFFNISDLIDPHAPQFSNLFVGAAASNRVLGGQAIIDGVVQAVILTPIDVAPGR